MPLVHAARSARKGGRRKRNAAAKATDPRRFYCPFPNCQRSCAELWRLRVHYRAPSENKGSGVERGHGEELSHCPRCGQGLELGKHHVGCSWGLAAPRQALKRGGKQSATRSAGTSSTSTQTVQPRAERENSSNAHITWLSEAQPVGREDAPSCTSSVATTGRLEVEFVPLCKLRTQEVPAWRLGSSAENRSDSLDSVVSRAQLHQAASLPQQPSAPAVHAATPAAQESRQRFLEHVADEEVFLPRTFDPLLSQCTPFRNPKPLTLESGGIEPMEGAPTSLNPMRLHGLPALDITACEQEVAQDAIWRVQGFHSNQGTFWRVGPSHQGSFWRAGPSHMGGASWP